MWIDHYYLSNHEDEDYFKVLLEMVKDESGRWGRTSGRAPLKGHLRAPGCTRSARPHTLNETRMAGPPAEPGSLPEDRGVA